MAASDKPFNNQRTLDIVFAVSNILMLLSVVWMFAQDYYREYKTEQRAFREVEVAMAQRAALESLPSEEEFLAAETKVKDLKLIRDGDKEKHDKAVTALDDLRLAHEKANSKADRDEIASKIKAVEIDIEKFKGKKEELAKARDALIGLQPKKEKTEAKFNEVNADVASFTSLRDIAIEHGDKTTQDKYEKLLKDRLDKLAEAQKNRDEIASQIKMEQLKIDGIEGKLTKAVADFKKVNDRFDAQVKLALNKRWGFGDWLRTQPVINGFADPLKIHQFTINDIPIDYNFKQVTRFDRCMSCHQGIDRPAYTREILEALTKEDSNKSKLEDAIKLYDRRIKALDDKDKAVIPNPGDLRLVTLSQNVLTPSRVAEFRAHPRLDLFVGSNSKHPAEKFGCTSCHSGQGSGTSFSDASHSPNSLKTREDWTNKHGWEFNHMWDFPMLPTRFVESSCLKCHHEVTDLISSDNRVEAPKLLRGHSLIRENGCFGCHEISGYKSGQRIGPDMRLEPNPPLESLSPIEYNRVVNDPDNRPGNLGKVGPSLARVSEKVSKEWIEKWLSAPSAFRPDTKMPHYYGLSTNSTKFLEENAPEQKSFPDTEMASIAHFLTVTSKSYLDDFANHQKDVATARQNDEQRLVELLNKGRLEEADQTEFAKIKERMRLRQEVPLEDLAPGYAGKAEAGRLLFSEKGCLACHTHQGTEVKAPTAPAVSSEAEFGPNLSQLTEKLTYKKSAQDARKWLIQWIIKPQVHSPRSRMPVTHLTPHEAADVAAWLLAQPAGDSLGADWANIKITPAERPDMENLAKVYLTPRMLSKSDTETFLKGLTQENLEAFRKGKLKDDSLKIILNDVGDDEKNLFYDDVKNDDSLKFYLGKKAVTRLGCFGCHDIPGFENTKSIGVGLNDWGKKPADRLAFEDIDNFYKAHYRDVESLVDNDGKPIEGIKDGKEPYELFYKQALMGHYRQREGYLNQKIRDPRSYDYNRIRAWDDRARMPQFQLARPRKKAGENEDDFKARTFKDEADAREAVATFVLGLVAEPVPIKSINQPKSDRLAEAKGRQVLDKYNCAGCHQIRPGIYEFMPGVKSMEELIAKHAAEDGNIQKEGEIRHLNHINWVGRNPLGLDRLTAFASQANYEGGEVGLRLNEALRFVNKDKSIANIPAGARLNLPIEDLGADPAKLKTQEDFDHRFQSVAPFGGRFTELMVPWLHAKDPLKYPVDGADARASLPPTLVGQGERTQPNWLYDFLINPQPVRRMTILRMPKFNLSKQEAEMLVDYFAAVTRQTNPGIGLAFPHEVIRSREEFSGAYWRDKNRKYLEYLKNADEKDENGKETGKKIYYSREKAYTKVWEQIQKDGEPALKKSLTKLEAELAAAKSAKEAKQKEVDAQKDAKVKAKLEEELKAFDSAAVAFEAEKKQVQGALQDLDVAKQREKWKQEEAYPADAYRMLLSRKLCTQCHQVGNTIASDQSALAKQGPPLDLAFARLRPDWIERWVDKPLRFVPYNSIMPQYLSSKEPRYQNLHAGPARAQIQALRDVLLNYPRIANLPVNRGYSPDRK